MRKLSKLWFLPVLVLFVIPAGTNACDDLLGLYFDTDASLACAEGVPPFTLMTMYLIYSNPTIAELYGMELGITVVGAGAMLMGLETFCGISINPVIPDLAQIQVGCGVSIPCVQHTILMRIEWLYISTTSEMILFFLHGAEDPSLPGDTPLILLGDGSWMPVAANEIGASEGLAAVMTSMFDVCYPLAADDQSWDSLKALYR